MFKLRPTIPAILILSIVMIMPVLAQPAPPPSAVDFYKQVAGDWVGTYEHSTEGEQAEDIYFKFSVKQADPSSFTGQFAYYRLNPATGDAEPAGTVTIQSIVQADGTVKNAISGQGTILIENKLKQQTYDLVETLCNSESSGLSGNISGKMSVSGLPLGVGKNGRVYNGSSIWSLDGDTLTIKQSLKVAFKVLLFNKSYALLASSKATRGTDLAAIMKESRVAERF